MTSANYHNKFVAVGDDGQRILKRSKKRTTEVAGKSSTLFEILLAARGSLIALCFVILLNVHFHYRTKDSLLGGMMRPKRAAVENVEPLQITPSFTKKFEDMVAGDKMTCQPEPVVFVKTHKTGGTTITNMILRHAERNSMLVGLPIQDHWELAGYPVSFDQRLVDPVAPKYDVLCHHFRFNHDEIEKKMNDNAAFVTIMRNPISNYESIFGFFRDYPFAQWVGRNGTLKNFLSDPERFYDKSTPWYFRAKNYMAYDLGFDNEDTSQEYARYAIEEMDKIFDLVMITDRFEESIVLLRDLLCMSDEDVIYLALKVRRETQSTELTTDEARKIREWNSLDASLYDHFEKKLDIAVEKFGRDKMSIEVNKLRSQLRDVEERCVDAYAQQRLTPWIRRIKLRRKSGDQCLKMTWGEVKFADHIRELQSERTDLPPQPSYIRQHILHHDVQRTVLGESPYIHADLML